MSQYFDPRPDVASRPSTVTLALPDLMVELETDRGVFSAGGIDPGTLELLRAGAPGGPAASTSTGAASLATGAAGEPHLLDLGCGYGPIAVALARRRPASTVWAVDINERAVALAASNATRLGLANLHATGVGGVPAGLRFGEIWSNPPIRVGKEALHSLLEEWLQRLAPGGRAWLVVHKHLGSDSLALWLEGRGFPTVRVSSKKGYRILSVAATAQR